MATTAAPDSSPPFCHPTARRRPSGPSARLGRHASPAGSGRTGWRPTASGRSPPGSSSSGARARSTTSSWPPAQRSRRGLPGARPHVRQAVPVPRLGRLQVARRRRLGAGSRARTPGSARWPTRPSGSSTPPSGPTATSTPSSQVLAPGTEYRDLAWGHELYCYGHLLQAAIAWHRALGDDRLLLVAERAVASVGARARAGWPRGDRRPSRDSRWRSSSSTGRPASARYLDFAAVLIDRRGHGPPRRRAVRARATGRTTSRSREAPSVAGHAVRQLYLDCGAVDVAVERGDQRAARRGPCVAGGTWSRRGCTSPARSAAATSDEAFGDPFELPPDLAYAETCAAIASVMLAWRLLLATGDPECADVIERTAVQRRPARRCRSDGTRFFYVNPLQRRTDRAWAAARPGRACDRGMRAPAARRT